MRLNWSASCKVLLVAQLALFSLSTCDYAANEFENRIAALVRVLNYLLRRPHQMNVDGLFGMTLAEAHLSATLYHPNVNLLGPQYQAFFGGVLESLRQARLHMRNSMKSESADVAMINMILNEPNLWTRPIFWQNAILGPEPKISLGVNPEMVEETMFRGSPQEKESDFCIGQLAAPETTGSKVCKVSDECIQMLLRDDNPGGYPLTHRLLYVQTARALNCSTPLNIHLVALIPIYCKSILQNLVDAEAMGFPSTSRDLTIEQVLLCGMQGFSEFVNNHYAKLIRSWLHPAGCYSSIGVLEQLQDMQKYSPSYATGPVGVRRASTVMDFGCESHTSGLAAGVLALLVRESVEHFR